MNCHMGECTTIDIDRKHANLATGSTDTYVNYLDCNEMICLNAIKCQKYCLFITSSFSLEQVFVVFVGLLKESISPFVVKMVTSWLLVLHLVI